MNRIDVIKSIDMTGKDSESIKKFLLKQPWSVPKKLVKQWIEDIEQRAMLPSELPLHQQFPGNACVEIREKVLIAAQQLRDNFKIEMIGNFYLSQRK